MALTAIFKSDNRLIVTLTDSDDNRVNGASVTFTLKDSSGDKVIDGKSMTADSDVDGRYTDVIDSDKFDVREEDMKLEVTATKDGNQRYAEPEVYVEPDKS